MLFDVITGIASALFIGLSLLYLFRKKIKLKISKLKFHCISGSILVLIALIHVNLKIFSPSFSFGFFALFTLILVAVTGFLKRRHMKSKLFYYAHIACVSAFLLTFVVHAAQQILNLLLM